MTATPDQLYERALSIQHGAQTISFAAALDLAVSVDKAQAAAAAEPPGERHEHLRLYARAVEVVARRPGTPIMQAHGMVTAEEAAWRNVHAERDPFRRDQLVSFARALSLQVVEPGLSIMEAANAAPRMSFAAEPAAIGAMSFSAAAIGDAPGEAKPFKLFRTGTFRSMEGKSVTITKADLEEIARRYDPDGHPAPFVIGHPTIDGPAQGWAKRLAVVGDALMCVGERISASFAALVSGGTYPRVSAQFFSAKDPANPKPGSLYLRHVGFLGAAAPGVTNLGRVSFD